MVLITPLKTDTNLDDINGEDDLTTPLLKMLHTVHDPSLVLPMEFYLPTID
jgi:hypothetical protein